MTRILALIGLLFALITTPAFADRATLGPIISEFATAKGFKGVEVVIDKLAATGDPEVGNALRALSAGNLRFRRSDGAVFIVTSGQALDPITRETVDVGTDDPEKFKKVRVKNSIRRKISAALSGLTLMSPSIDRRLRAASTIFETADASALEALEVAIKDEQNQDVKAAFEDARASATLASGRDDADKITAVKHIAARGDREALSLLSRFEGQSEGELKSAIANEIAKIESSLAIWANAQNIWYGISLGSVLLLAAIGLAITFGVMGVINMAHGEMVMLGAYTTFAVQEFIRATAPELFGWSLAIALPLAFLVSGTVGLIMERGLIRFLYGRPLETLLATWGVSLILQQTVRSIFGPTNREVGNPDWMSGAFELGQLSITWNRLWIFVFAMAVFAALFFIINRTSFGLDMRAVTQNRRMAGAMGIRTSWVDAMTFALGSGIAGIAGVALSQIGNVSPNLGQSYIIDSFLVVVFGGVGNLWGTLVGAMSLGIINKFLEPYAGAVLGKVIVLIAIILFIQKRPRGLFALKGRAVES
ncbi:urea ABC transporter permease subunit UrtB [Ahrensia sp. R2A130]|uniref:urea ABC transporter permease subunit UrtB n=1 Tax=Ahrensia sp. R2A130 TaxID=744979 RepID=UPI0001E0D84A|nr:urea ABC transporter permease subunit UrtB [Ahrensia sp. R2A130]EFL89296.1 inner-membrane translocator [Ahrensia sp. R2A130]